MPRHYKRKTKWGSTPLEDMERAANDVKGGKSIRAVAKEKNIDRSTLRRYIKKKEGQEVKTTGYSGTAEAKRDFTEELEKELADHIKKLADQNNIPVPNNWKEKGLAGRMCKTSHNSVAQLTHQGSIGTSTRSGWINEDTFAEFLEHSSAHQLLL
uniref:HTH psq-type domain-containing protein n=1 Tax=Sinocyclocheilus rhinocerous TaxID=307959 RepID=A0A673KIP5_9TELE